LGKKGTQALKLSHLNMTRGDQELGSACGHVIKVNRLLDKSINQSIQ